MLVVYVGNSLFLYDVTLCITYLQGNSSYATSKFTSWSLLSSPPTAM